MQKTVWKKIKPVKSYFAFCIFATTGLLHTRRSALLRDFFELWAMWLMPQSPLLHMVGAYVSRAIARSLKILTYRNSERDMDILDTWTRWLSKLVLYIHSAYMNKMTVKLYGARRTMLKVIGRVMKLNFSRWNPRCFFIDSSDEIALEDLWKNLEWNPLISFVVSKNVANLRPMGGVQTPESYVEKSQVT